MTSKPDWPPTVLRGRIELKHGSQVKSRSMSALMAGRFAIARRTASRLCEGSPIREKPILALALRLTYGVAPRMNRTCSSISAWERLPRLGMLATTQNEQLWVQPRWVETVRSHFCS